MTKRTKLKDLDNGEYIDQGFIDHKDCNNINVQCFYVKDHKEKWFRSVTMDGDIYEFFKCYGCNRIFQVHFKRSFKQISKKKALKFLGGAEEC